MSNCSFCGHRQTLIRAEGPDLKIDNFTTNVPLRGQVFGLPSPSEHPPFISKKLNDREIREGIEKHELWLYVPPWQVPRIGARPYRIGCDPFIHYNVPMKKILCMAKRNKALNGCIGRLQKFVFPHFGKCELKIPSEKSRIRPKHDPDINKMKGRKKSQV